MRICVLGLGYIGLPTALLLSRSNEVHGVDIDDGLVSQINKETMPFSEPGLEELWREVSTNFTAGSEVKQSDVFIVAVPTPLEKSARVADLSAVRKAMETIIPHLQEGNMVVLESTVPPGTSSRLIIPMIERTGLERGQFLYAYCPERAIPGRTLDEMVNNDRVIGTYDQASAKQAKDVYSSFVQGAIITTSPTTAEFVKLMENTYRDVNIALANEFAQIAEMNSIDVWEAISLANRHPRVSILRPGPGVGGHCIAIDPLFLAENAGRFGIISAAREINNAMPNYLMSKIRQVLGDPKMDTITLLGLAYKAEVDDTRETPSRKVIALAENEGYQVRIHDPYVTSFERPLMELEKAVDGSDCLVVLTGHSRFRNLEPESLGKRMRNRNIIDCRNIIDPVKWQRAGFRVQILGNGSLD